MLQSVRFVGLAVRRARNDAIDLVGNFAGVSFDVSLLLGGQIGGKQLF